MDEQEPFDLDDWPEALAAYRQARALGRRCTEEAAVTGLDKGRGAAERELARWKARLAPAGLDAASLARLREAIRIGEVEGRRDVEGEKRERTVFPTAGE